MQMRMIIKWFWRSIVDLVITAAVRRDLTARLFSDRWSRRAN